MIDLKIEKSNQNGGLKSSSAYKTQMMKIKSKLIARIDGLNTRLRFDTSNIENLTQNMTRLTESFQKMKNLKKFYDQLLDQIESFCGSENLLVKDPNILKFYNLFHATDKDFKSRVNFSKLDPETTFGILKEKMKILKAESDLLGDFKPKNGSENDRNDETECAGDRELMIYRNKHLKLIQIAKAKVIFFNFFQFFTKIFWIYY